MNEALRESASAFLDGEQSELELQRLLKGKDSDSARDWISRQYAVRAVIRNDRDTLSPVALQGNIFDALAAEPAHSTQAGARGAMPGWMRPVAGFAVAASVCAAVVFGVSGARLDAIQSSEPAIAEAKQPLAELPSSPRFNTFNDGNLRTVGFGDVAPVSLRESSVNAQTAERLNFYLRQHAERASLNSSQGMLPMARVVDFREQ